MASSEGLTDKQRAFAHAYATGTLPDGSADKSLMFNGTRCYKAIYGVKTDKTAGVNAAKLLGNTRVQGYMQELREASKERSTVTLTRTLEEIGRVAFADIRDALEFNDRGITLKDSEELPSDITAAIESVTFTETFTEEGGTSTKKGIKLHSKISALKLLASYFGIDSDFNQARAILKRYGIALVKDADSEIGWKTEKHDI